jgi:hypothetical protein
MADSDPIEWKLYDDDLVTIISLLPAAEGSRLYLELNEPGSGVVVIPATSAAASLVAVNQFVACYYRGAYRGGFLVDNIEVTEASSGEHGDRWTKISGRGPLALLDEAIIWPEDVAETTREFSDYKMSEMLVILMAEASMRGALDRVTVDFTGAVDSNGVAWTDANYYRYTNGETLLEVLRDVAKLGFEFTITFGTTTPGWFTLHAYKNPTGTDKSETIYMRTGTNCEEISRSTKSSELTNAYLVKYAKNYTSAEDPVSIAANRRREGMYHADEANAEELAREWGNAMLDAFSDPRSEIQVAVYDGVKPYAFVDYIVGDTIVLDSHGTETDYRIRGIELTWDGEFASITLSLNTSFVEHHIRVAQEVERLRRLYTNAHDSNLIETNYWSAIGGDVEAGADEFTYYVFAIENIGHKIYVAGSLKINTTVYNLSSYDIYTGEWAELTPGVGINALCVIGTDLYAASDHLIRKYDTLTSTWSTIGTVSYIVDASDTPTVSALATDGTNLYAGGVFTGITGGVTVYNVAKWNGTVWTALATGTGGSGYTAEVRALCWHGTDLIAGGEFTVAGSAVANYLARWNGTTWAAFANQPDAPVWALASDGTNIYAGGEFPHVGVLDVNYVAMFDGAAWSAMGYGVSGRGDRYTMFSLIYKRHVCFRGRRFSNR